MSRLHFCSLAVMAVACSIFVRAQIPGFTQPQGEKVDGDVALDRALEVSSLTFDGKPFHAVVEIGAPQTPYSGRVEVWWVDATKYRTVVMSPEFSQTRTVNGDRVEEKNDGDYYPRWLENFVLAILDPMPIAKNLRGRPGSAVLGEKINGCLSRDDRPGGITDQMTFGEICLGGSEPHLTRIIATNISIQFSDWKAFGKKEIARTYDTYVLGHQPVVGRLTTLEELTQPDEAMFAIDAVTPPDQRITTTFVSTLREESLTERTPMIQWPTVREGKTDGYMIVYARTDRTGQVREASKFTSDQPGLESFGMQQALKYKFKPLIVDGVAQQMEMPLVLHFSTTLANPIPILSLADMKKQIIACKISGLARGTPKGTVVQMRISVDEKGKVTGMGPLGDAGSWWLGAVPSIGACRFAPYIVNGSPTYYKGDIEIVAP